MMDLLWMFLIEVPSASRDLFSECQVSSKTKKIGNLIGHLVDRGEGHSSILGPKYWINGGETA